MAFSPSDLAGLSRWYAADDLSGSHGDLLSAWADKSANAANLAALGATRPSLVLDRWNAKPGVLFSGAQRMSNNSASGRPVAGVTVLVVASLYRQGSFPQYLAWGSGGTNGWNLYANTGADANAYPPAFILRRSGGAWGDELATATQASQFSSRGAPQLLTGIRDAATCRVRADGVETSDSGAAGDIDYGASPELFVGDKGAALFPLRGCVHEIILYDGALSSADLAAVEAYLDTKWRLTLPKASHLMAYNGRDANPGYDIGVAFSPDGRHFKRHSANPVLSPTGSGWEATDIKDPCILWDGTQWVMYYSGLNTKYQIGRATSADGLTWTRYGSNPVLSFGGSGAWDENGVAFPAVLYDPTAPSTRRWRMWFIGIKASDGKARIGHAYSSDGITWTKHGQVLDVGTSGAWDDEGIGIPGPHYENGTFYLFYNGRSDPTFNLWGIGLATTADPEGTYTKDGANPLIARRSQSGTSQTPTDIAVGGRTVTVPSAHNWAARELLYLADSDSDSEYVRILTIDSTTQVTVEMPTRSAFTSPPGAVARAAARVSIAPRSIRKLPDGTYVLYGTGFQPVEDLSVGGSKLREWTFAWTAPALTGPWSYDHDRGMLMEIEDHSSRWDYYSAENPFVADIPPLLPRPYLVRQAARRAAVI